MFSSILNKAAMLNDLAKKNKFTVAWVYINVKKKLRNSVQNALSP